MKKVQNLFKESYQVLLVYFIKHLFAVICIPP